MRVLLSIKPEHADRILEGKKRFEYRRRVFSQDVSSVVLYASTPIRKLVGEFQVGEILHDHPENLWKATAGEGGVSSEQFFDYFDGCERGYAIAVEGITKYDTPIDPSDVFIGFRAPQSFSYVT